MQRTRWAATAVTLLAVLASPRLAIDARACGEKFLISDENPERAAVATSATPLAVLIYAEAPGADVEASQLVAALRQAGHSVDVVTDLEALRGAASAGDHDLVVADYGDALQIRDAVREADPDLRIVPILAREQRSNLTAARREFGAVVNVPTRLSRMLSVIEGVAVSR